MPYKNYLILAVILRLCLLHCHTYAQADTSFLTHTLLEKQSTAFPIEKVYLQTDKSNYDVFDTVWYKAYTVALYDVEYHKLIKRMPGVNWPKWPMKTGTWA